MRGNGAVVAVTEVSLKGTHDHSSQWPAMVSGLIEMVSDIVELGYVGLCHLTYKRARVER